MNPQTGAGEPDAAWASLSLPLAPQALQAMMGNVEVLLRVNPCLEFDHLARLPDGRLQLAGRNESNQQAFAATADHVARDDGRGFSLRYDAGIKRETRFEIAPDAAGSLLTITETYAAPPAAGEARLAEVDRSLVPWAAALRAHLLRQSRWGKLPGYILLVEHFWLEMPPRQRRIARMIIWTTLLEFLVFLAVLAIYVAR